MNLWGISISNLPAKAKFSDERHANALRVIGSVIIAFLAIAGFLGMLLKEAVDMRAIFGNPFGTIVFAALALMSYTLLTRTATGGGGWLDILCPWPSFMQFVSLLARIFAPEAIRV